LFLDINYLPKFQFVSQAEPTLETWTVQMGFETIQAVLQSLQKFYLQFVPTNSSLFRPYHQWWLPLHLIHHC